METPKLTLESLPLEILVNIFSGLDRKSKLVVRSLNWNLLTSIDDSNLVKFCVHLSDETVETVVNLTTKLPLSSLMVEGLSKAWPMASWPQTRKLAFRNGNSAVNTIRLLKDCSAFTSSLAFHGYSFAGICASRVPQINCVLQNWMTLKELQIMFRWPDDKDGLEAHCHFKSLSECLEVAVPPAIQRLTVSIYLPKKKVPQFPCPEPFKCAVHSFIRNNSSTLTEINLSYAGLNVGDFGSGNNKPDTQSVEPVRMLDNLLVYRAKLNTNFKRRASATVIPVHLKLMRKLRIFELTYESETEYLHSKRADVSELPEFRAFIFSNCGSLEGLTLNFPIQALDWFPVCPQIKHFCIEGTKDGTLPDNINHFPALTRFSFAPDQLKKDRETLLPALWATIRQFPDLARMDAAFFRGVVLDEMRQFLKASKLTRLSLAMERNCPGYIIFSRFCDKTPGLRFTLEEQQPLYYWDKKEHGSGRVEMCCTIHIDRSTFGN